MLSTIAQKQGRQSFTSLQRILMVTKTAISPFYIIDGVSPKVFLPMISGKFSDTLTLAISRINLPSRYETRFHIILVEPKTVQMVPDFRLPINRHSQENIIACCRFLI